MVLKSPNPKIRICFLLYSGFEYPEKYVVKVYCTQNLSMKRNILLTRMLNTVAIENSVS